MLIKKTIETSLDLNNPLDIFSINLNTIIINKLTDKYVNKCFNSCFILKINRIIRRSMIYMKDSLDGGSYVNILFEVDAIVYTKGEIIHDVTIVKKEINGILHAKSKYAGIQLNMKSNSSIYNEGDIVPVIVRAYRANPFQSAISIAALPFIPIHQKPIIYKISEELSTSDKKDLTNLLKTAVEYETFLNTLSGADIKVCKFFIDLLYNSKYDISTKIPNKKISDLSSLFDLHTLSVIYCDIKYNDSNIYIVDTKKELKNAGYDIIEQTPFIVFSLIINKFIFNVQTLQGFLTNYPSYSIVQQNKDVWKLYNSLK